MRTALAGLRIRFQGLHIWAFVASGLLLAGALWPFLLAYSTPHARVAGATVWKVASVRGELWLGTSEGTYRFEGANPKRVVESETFDIAVVGSAVWMATADGLQQGRFDPRGGVGTVGLMEARMGDDPLTRYPPRVDRFEGSAPELWLVGPFGVFAVADTDPPVLDEEPYTDLYWSPNALWTVREGATFRNGARALSRPITGLASIGALDYVTTGDTLSVTVPDGAVRSLPASTPVPVRAIAVADGILWLGTDTQTFAYLSSGPAGQGPEFATWANLGALRDARSVGQREIGGTTRGPLLLGLPPEPLIPRSAVLIAAAPYLFTGVVLGIAGTLGLVLGLSLVPPRSLHEQKGAAVSLARLEHEVREAKAQMDRLFPAPETFSRPGLEIAHRRVQASTVSGDFYNFVPRGDGSVGVYFVDVEGHGLDAAIQARSFYQLVNDPDRDWGRGDACRELEAADQLVAQSDVFRRDETALTMNFVELDPVKREIRLANAGMPYPLLFRARATQPEQLQASGLYVGAGYARHPVTPREVRCPVEDGDLLVIVSDGILEARDESGRVFGRSGLTAAVYRARDRDPDTVADEILRSVREHGGDPPEDDQTLVVVRIGGAGEVSAGGRPKLSESRPGRFLLLNAPDPAWVELRGRVGVWAAGHENFCRERANQISSATQEAVQNALTHGSRVGEVIEVELWPAAPAAGMKLLATVRQPGEWEDWDRMLGVERRRRVRETHERLVGGTVIMLWLADEVSVRNRGREVALTFGPEVVPPRRLEQVSEPTTSPADQGGA